MHRSRQGVSWLAALHSAIAAVALTSAAATAQQFQLTDAQFDSWITNGRGQTQELVESQLRAQLGLLSEACKLSDDQQQKLLLAGQGDLDRYLAEVAALRTKLVGKQYEQRELNEVYGEIQPLAKRLEQGLLGAGSLFQKVKGSLLDDEQRAAYVRWVSEQNTFHFRAKLKLFVAALDQLAPMSGVQRERLLELLVDSTRPPNRQTGSQMDWWYVVVQVADVPADRVADILDAAQMRCFQQAAKQAPQFRDMLKMQNVVPFDEEAAAALPAIPPAMPVAAPAPVIFRMQLDRR